MEHFQNQFIIQRNNIDEIMHLIKQNENAIIEEINSNPVAVDHRKVKAHTEEKEQMESFEKKIHFSDYKKSFFESLNLELWTIQIPKLSQEFLIVNNLQS